MARLQIEGEEPLLLGGFPPRFGADSLQRPGVIDSRSYLLVLVEIAPGMDLERDLMAHMSFRPKVADEVREMDPRLFRPEPMGYLADLMAKPRLNIPERLRRERESDHD